MTPEEREKLVEKVRARGRVVLALVEAGIAAARVCPECGKNSFYQWIDNPGPYIVQGCKNGHQWHGLE
jgi:hypothetical protein